MKYTHILTGETYHMNKWDMIISDLIGFHAPGAFRERFLRRTK